MIEVLKCFFREFWCALMFWNALLEGAILISTYVLKCIFWGSNLMWTCVLKHIYWRSNCFDLWLLISMATAYTFMVAAYCGCWSVFFTKVFTTSRTYAILTSINTNLRCRANWLQSLGKIVGDPWHGIGSGKSHVRVWVTSDAV